MGKKKQQQQQQRRDEKGGQPKNQGTPNQMQHRKKNAQSQGNVQQEENVQQQENAQQGENVQQQENAQQEENVQQQENAQPHGNGWMVNTLNVVKTGIVEFFTLFFGWMVNTLNVVKTGIVEFFTLFFGWIASNRAAARALFYGWIWSIRGLGTVSFILSMMCTCYHWNDEWIKDSFSNMPTLLALCSAPTITFMATYLFVWISGARELRPYYLAFLFFLTSCVGVITGSIINNILMSVNVSRVSEGEMMYVSIVFAVISFLITALDYEWQMTLRDISIRFALISLVWTIVLLTLFPLFPVSSYFFEVLQFSLFTVAMGIVEYFITTVYSCVSPCLASFPARNIGCLTQSSAMMFVAIYYFTWRIEFLPWMITSGSLVCGVTLVCYVCEKIFGIGVLSHYLLKVAGFGVVVLICAAGLFNGLGLSPDYLWTTVRSVLGW